MATHLPIGFDSPRFMRALARVHPGVDVALPPLDGDYISLAIDAYGYRVRFRGGTYFVSAIDLHRKDGDAATALVPGEVKSD